MNRRRFSSYLGIFLEEPKMLLADYDETNFTTFILVVKDWDMKKTVDKSEIIFE